MYFLFIQYILSTEQMHFVITEFRLSTKCFKNSEVLTELSEKASTRSCTTYTLFNHGTEEALALFPLNILFL